jgi:hypothetical protein
LKAAEKSAAFFHFAIFLRLLPDLISGVAPQSPQTPLATASKKSHPDLTRPFVNPHFTQKYHDVYQFGLQARRIFHGIGPEISWKASQPLFGEAETGEVAFD